jgi:hypothetical protein
MVCLKRLRSRGRILHKPKSSRAILLIVAAAFLSTAFAFSNHFVSRGEPKIISLDLQVKRLMSRAERENLRTGVVVVKAPDIVRPASTAGHPTEAFQVLVAYQPSSSYLLISKLPEISRSSLSTVILNL